VLKVKKSLRAAFTVICLLITIVSTSVPLLALAVEYTLGVKDGDWVKYGQVTVSWSGNGTEPAQIVELEKVQWLRVDFENASGTTVLANITIQFNNGTQQFANQTQDVTGNTRMTSSLFLIASNLKGGDPIANQQDSPTINQTTTGTYAGAGRNVNLLEATSTVLNQTVTSNVTWDQNTGVMVETYSKTPYPPTPGGYIEISFKATETNLWSPDLTGFFSDNLLFIIAGILIAAIVITIAVILKRKPQPTTQTPTPSTTDHEPEMPRAFLRLYGKVIQERKAT